MANCRWNYKRHNFKVNGFGNTRCDRCGIAPKPQKRAESNRRSRRAQRRW